MLYLISAKNFYMLPIVAPKHAIQPLGEPVPRESLYYHCRYLYRGRFLECYISKLLESKLDPKRSNDIFKLPISNINISHRKDNSQV